MGARRWLMSCTAASHQGPGGHPDVLAILILQSVLPVNSTCTVSLFPQYCAKEEMYKEEIKNLIKKLKEVRPFPYLPK